jgi:hypothetical protein
MASGATVSQECIRVYNDLKLSKKYRYLIYGMSAGNKEIVVLAAGAAQDWDTFLDELPANEPRYVVYDFQYELASGDGMRNKLAFIAWSPDTAGVQQKMIYAASKEGLKRSLTGIGIEVQANDSDDVAYDIILKTVSKGLAA